MSFVLLFKNDFPPLVLIVSSLLYILSLGEKLAETNGKLTKELKRLRNCLGEQEQLAKKAAQAEVDRDLAREEVRGLTAEAGKLRGKSCTGLCTKVL